MLTSTETPQVADTPKTSYVTVKIRAAIHKKARQVATFHDVNIADYVSELLEKLVDADYRKMRKSMDVNDHKENDK